MSSLKQAVEADRSAYIQVEPPQSARGAAFSQLEPVRNTVMRCPLPPVQVTPDSLRQFYMGGQVPQMRLLTPPSNITGSSGGTVISTTNITTASTSSSSSVSLAATSASFTTPTINPNAYYSGSVLLAKSFQLLSIAANAPCEIRMYGSQAEQLIDAGRSLDQAPSAGVWQNIITDVALDSSPYIFYCQNRNGANADSPQTSLIYITVFNIGTVSQQITASFQYVALEQ